MEGVCSKQCSNAAASMQPGQGRAGKMGQERGRPGTASNAQAGIATQGRAALRKARRILKQSSRKED